MATHLVNLDALITREDFEVREDAPPQPSQLTNTIKVSELEPGSLLYQTLRKPDFQRETANWTPHKIKDFVKSFIDGDLIPAIILWRAPDTASIFVIDGAHRLSALIAWVHDDYGDRAVSVAFFDNLIPEEQKKAAETTRTLVNKEVGSYQDLKDALKRPDNVKQETLRRARNASSIALQLQWVHGDAGKAETSFFRINQEATPIDQTELEMIEARAEPNALAARALIRSGVGHKYWSAFPKPNQEEIERHAREIYDTLFKPVLEEPIKTLDLPVAGRGYSAGSVKLMFDFVNLANGLIEGQKTKTKGKTGQEKEDRRDKDGSQTIRYLKRVKRIASRISGDSPSSLGLHPAVYFYGATGRYQPTAFLAVVRLIDDLDATNSFIRFTEARSRLEEFLLGHRYFINQIVTKHGSGRRGYGPVFNLYKRVLNGIEKHWSDDEIVASLKNSDFKYLTEMTQEERKAKASFSTETRSTAFLRDAIEKALRCAICKARIHRKSISFDHISRRQDGGSSDVDNAQLTHPYCNTGYKESQHAKSKGRAG